MNPNIDISDVEDFKIELVNPEFEQVYIKNFFIVLKYCTIILMKMKCKFYIMLYITYRAYELLLFHR